MNTSIVAPFFQTWCIMQDTVIFYGKTTNFIMAALWNTAGHYIFALWFLLSFFLSIYLALVAFSALTLLVVRQEGHQPVKNVGDDGGGHCLVQMEWRPTGWSVCLPLLIFPCTIKFRSSLLAPAHPRGAVVVVSIYLFSSPNLRLDVYHT